MPKVQFKERAHTDLIVVHCAATRPKMDVGVREIRQWHVQRGFLDVGYHFIIRRDGTVEEGRPHNVVGAHVSGKNSVSVGICLVGGVDDKLKPENNFTPAQFEALKVLLAKVEALYPKAKICGHRDLDSGKACPSFDVRQWLTTI